MNFALNYIGDKTAKRAICHFLKKFHFSSNPFYPKPPTLKMTNDYKLGGIGPRHKTQKQMKTRKHEMAQFYREQVQKIEKEILAITNNATDVNFSDEKSAYLVALIDERKEILDVMFANAVREVECIEQVNELLRKVTQKMCDCVITTRNKVKSKLSKGEPGESIEVEGNIRFVANEEDAVRALPEDEYYGSNFAKVLLVIHRLYEQGYVRPDYIDSISSKDLNDDTLSQRLAEMSAYEDWQPAAEAFKGLDICFALHSLSAYHPYSIPDILRMRKFGLMINIRHRMPTISL